MVQFSMWLGPNDVDHLSILSFIGDGDSGNQGRTILTNVTLAHY